MSIILEASMKKIAPFLTALLLTSGVAAFSASPAVDLTSMKGVMLCAAVHDIKKHPENYVGRRITMTGQFAIVQGFDEWGMEDPDKIFCACTFSQALDSLEFCAGNELQHPEDFIDLGTTVTVSGVYEAYEDNGKVYYRVGNAAVKF